MAYGKDPKVLGNAGSFRQRANQYQQQRQAARPRGKGGGLYWATQYKPPLDEPDTIRILEGHYKVQQVTKDADGNPQLEEVELPFFPYAEHYDGREEKSAICSAGPFQGFKDKASPCHGCDLFWTGMEKDQNGKKKAGRMSRRELYAFSIIDYGVYHNVEQVDRNTGQVRINENSGEPYMQWVKCEGQGCDACRAGKETVRGRTRHWGLGWGHYNALLDADKKIGKSCSNCAGVNTVKSLAWICGNPECGNDIVDMRTTTMKQKEIDELVEKPATCPACGYHGFLQEIIECGQCTPAGGQAKRATIFDVDMQVNRVQASDGSNNTSLSISQWSEPRPVDPNFKQLAEPLDLAKTYAPTPLEAQATMFKIPAGGVRKPVTASDASRPYQR